MDTEMRRLLWILPLLILITSTSCRSEPEAVKGPTATTPAPKEVPKSGSEDRASLKQRVELSLLADKGVSGFNIDVQVNGEAVTLAGTVDSADSKSAAEKVVAGTEGVSSVANRLEVAAEAKQTIATSTDVAIEDRIEKAMDTDSDLRGLSLAAESKDGVVTLRGLVQDNDQLVRAARAIRRVQGVKAVTASEVGFLSQSR